ncbi:MAG: quinone-dependent dihydroorotate dehydrogenase [Balneolaceae bacterium]|nr:MAG: quinone-dependent dihydroorotate dehydrogenase [Balneolaceae bacterium]
MYKFLVRPLLFRLSSDYTHEITIKSASLLSKYKWLLHITEALYGYSNNSLEQKIGGLRFPNPIGLAAGFDKNGTAAPFMQSLGFGFVEIGSVTANSCIGNPKPRTFRLPADQSLINRLGLNNEGVLTISRRLKYRDLKIPMGVNIAKTHDPSIIGEKAIEDYRTSFNLVKNIADYITLNISCPNTTEGKTFEEPESLNNLLKSLGIEKDASLPPVFVKFSVDLDDSLLYELLNICEGYAIEGYVATNTSSLRENLKTPESTIRQIGKGGLSGKAICSKSTEIIQKIYSYTKGLKTIIGVGGVSSTEDAIEKLKAGADLLQIYTGLVYEGPPLVKRINRGLTDYMKKHGIDHVYHIRKVKNQ